MSNLNKNQDRTYDPHFKDRDKKIATLAVEMS